MGAFIIGVVFLVFIIVLFVALDASKKKNELKGCINKLPGFESEEPLCSTTVAVGVNAERNAFAVACRVNEVITTKRIEARDFREVTVELVGSSTKTKKTGFVSFTSEQFADQINLLLKFKDKEFPVLRIPLYMLTGKPSANAKLSQDAALAMGQAWEAKILTVANSHDEREPKQAESSNVVSELAELHRLLKDGAITDEEYKDAKSILLGK